MILKMSLNKITLQNKYNRKINIKKTILIYVILMFQTVNAQQNDITTAIFSWTDYPNTGNAGIQAVQNYTSPALIRWNENKVEYDEKIKVWEFDMDEFIPPNLEDEETQMNALLTSSIMSWNNNYPIKIELNNNAEKGVYIVFWDSEEYFIIDHVEETYAVARTHLPVIWNGNKNQGETQFGNIRNSFAFTFNKS